MNWIARHESELLVFAAFLAALVAIYSSWKASHSVRENRRGQMRERWVSEFRDAMAGWLSLTEDPSKLQSEEYLHLRRIEHALELSFDREDEDIKTLRDAMQELRGVVGESELGHEAFMARNHVKNIARRIIQSEWKKARDGK